MSRPICETCDAWRWCARFGCADELVTRLETQAANKT